MPAQQNKTQPTDVDPVAFIAAVDHPRRRADAEVLLGLMSRATGCPPTMWGPSIVGFGRYRYRYDTGREGEFLMAGFAPRQANLVVYILPGLDQFGDELDRLGKHKVGRSCLYINKLDDVDLAVLESIVVRSMELLDAEYETFRQ